MLAAMYKTAEEDDGDEADVTVVDVGATYMGADKFVSFVINGETITVPSIGYVSHLERQIMTKDGEIASLKGQLGTVGQSVSRHDGTLKNASREAKEMLLIKSQMKAIRTMVQRHETDLNDVWRDLDRKMNLRD